MVSLLLSNPRGLCAGVERALNIVELALEAYPPPIYVRHEIVHNRYLVDNLRKRGVVFIEDLHEVPDNSVVIFSAHGVPSSVEREARSRSLEVIDSTCPLVTKVHIQVARISHRGEECVLIGHSGHPEVKGTLGRFDASFGGAIYLVESVEQAGQLQVHNQHRLHYVSQTTLSLDETKGIVAALRQRFPNITAPRRDDICYATQNRQNAVKQLCSSIDLLLVVGSPNSSNSRRLCEIGKHLGVQSYLLDHQNQLTRAMLGNAKRLGLTAGASAPPALVDQLIERICKLSGAKVVELDGPVEDVNFGLPREARMLQQRIAAANL